MAGCEGPDAVPAAKLATDEFHAHFAKKDYTRIYWAADSRLHLATTETNFVDVLTAVQRKLGDYHESQLLSYKVQESLLGETSVSLAYQTTFADGQAVETFRYVMDRGDANLFAYNIDSAALIT